MLKFLKKQLSQAVQSDVHPSLTSFQEISHWRLIYDSEDPPIGRGGYSNVYFGEWEGQPVAIKKFKTQTQKSDVQEIAANELSILSNIGRHPNLVYCYGQSTSCDHLHLVFEYVSGGELTHYLIDNRLTAAQRPIREKIALQVAQALVYLWSLRIIHRDIKSDNILLDNHNNPKIADFGFCVQLDDSDDTYVTYDAAGTMGWVPPEAFSRGFLSPGICTETYDIWSYAIVLWMLASDRVFEPFPLNRPDQIEAFALQGISQPMSRTITNECKALLTRCWNKDPKNRPKAQEIVDTLQGGLKLSK